jgi:hypothetical protein
MKAAGGDQALHAPAWMIQPNVLKSHHRQPVYLGHLQQLTRAQQKFGA